jgi:hypothetical protein
VFHGRPTVNAKLAKLLPCRFDLPGIGFQTVQQETLVCGQLGQ